jgi:hypothetical protein
MSTEQEPLAPAPEPAIAAPSFTSDSVDSGTITMGGFYPPKLIVGRLSAAPGKQPVAALASANQHRAELTDVFLQAIERGVGDPIGDFSNEGMLFNYAAYFLAKWREPRAYPLFLRWFSLPGELALELGGDTVTHDGARFLASVCGGEIESLKTLVGNGEAHPSCRGQALMALAVLAAWGEQPRDSVEAFALSLARESLERRPGQIWNDLAALCVSLELISVFPELRRACEEKLIDPQFLRAESFDQVEKEARGAFLKGFTERHPPITDVVKETRWWAGFQSAATPRHEVAPTPHLEPGKVGRNDPCPCGSGKKYKKCCGR